MNRPLHSWFSIAAVACSLGITAGASASGSDDVSILSNEVDKASNESLLWGPYKSNLYFGVRPRIPQSLATGLLWAKVDDYGTAQNSKLYLVSFPPLIHEGLRLAIGWAHLLIIS